MVKTFRTRSTWLTRAALLGFLILAIAAMLGCSSATGQKLAERPDVFNAMRNMGYEFDETLVSTGYGESPSQVIVTGPFGGPPLGMDGSVTDKGVICPYSRAILNKINGKWVIAALEKRSLGWWPLQSALDICSK